MVFDVIYSEYERRIIEELRETTNDENIEEMLESGEIHDIILKN